MAVDLSQWEREQMEGLSPMMTEPIIVLDPGHGGSDPGAVGHGGLRESDTALAIVDLMRPALQDLGWEVWQTRSGDTYVALRERCTYANAMQADLFISVHCNSFHNRAAHGFEVWTSPGQTKADPVATRIYNSGKRTFPTIAGRPDLGDGDPDKEARFRVLVGTLCPAVLVECAFISNPREEAWLADPGFRLRMAGALVSGIGRKV